MRDPQLQAKMKQWNYVAGIVNRRGLERNGTTTSKQRLQRKKRGSDPSFGEDDYAETLGYNAYGLMARVFGVV